MSERFSICPDCNGLGYLVGKDSLSDGSVWYRKDPCFRCLDSGFDGSAESFMKREADKDQDYDKWNTGRWDEFLK